MPTQRDNPYPNFNFLVEIGGDTVAGFSEVELPEGRVEVVEYREGSDKTTQPRRLPGRVSHGPLVLRRGLDGRGDLFQWWRAVRDGAYERRTVVVVLLDEARDPVASWRFRNAWPAAYRPSPLNARGNDVAVETLELAHEGFELE
jgi:phage tail-like protein